ncbi:MAG: folate-binding protein [Acidobacteriaceae bacterium]
MTDPALSETLTSAALHPADSIGGEIAADFGDVRGEFNSLLSGCGIWNLSWRAKLELTGADRTRWLNGMVTNNVRDLPSGRGVYAFLLNPQGRIQGDLYVYNAGDSLLLDTDRSQVEKLLAFFDHYIIMDEVEVKNRTESLTAIGIAGPRAQTVLQAAGLDVVEITPMQFASVPWAGKSVTLVSSDRGNSTLESYELWVSPDDVPGLRRSLLKAGASPVGSSACDLLNIASGIPRYGIDIREKDLPQETGQERALNFSKGCYVGQEIVERIRSRGAVHRQFTGFEVTGPLPSAGTKIQVEGKDVGEITSSAVLPVADRDMPVALGYLRREFANPAKLLQAGQSKLTVAALPFADILK